ncbi:MAG: transcriptional repressor LexA [Planctomycetes bacterium]|nr:transcriptional repressor LexA [Planctomycetota bacterium]
MALTKKQAQILAWLETYVDDRGYAPTMEEIGEHFGVSPVTAYEHVKALEAKGAIRTERNRARSIEIVRDGGTWPRVPLLGRIAAGLPIEALSHDEVFDFESLFPPGGDCFILEVKGHSMIEDHIQDGDLVVVASRQTARPGETVVALIRDEEATLKRFYPEGRKVRLEPANASMKPIIVPAEEVRIQGVVLGVMRRY